MQCAAAEFRIHVVKTLGDRDQGVPLHAFPSTGVFVHEIAQILLSGSIDIAVHSLKDVPPDATPGLCLAAFPERADPRDVIISRDGQTLSQLPSGSRIGTSSIRRQAQLRAVRPDLVYCDDLRGNVDTRLRKLYAGVYDAIVLAAAGLIRLNRSAEITEYLAPELCLPDVGQGTLGVQARSTDSDVLRLVATIDDPRVRAVALAERAVLATFGGGCKVPVAAYGQIVENDLRLDGLVATPDGSRIIRASLTGPLDSPQELGYRLWTTLVEAGALEVLADAVPGL